MNLYGIDVNESDIVKYLKEADAEAYRYTNYSYTVYLYEYGSLDVESKLSCDTCYSNISANPLHTFCHNGFDVIDDYWFANGLDDNCDGIPEYIASEYNSQDMCPHEFLESNYPDIYNEQLDLAIQYIISEAESDGYYDEWVGYIKEEYDRKVELGILKG